MDEHEHGKMDVTEQEKVFAGFITWTARTLVLIGIVLIFMAITQT